MEIRKLIVGLENHQVLVTIIISVLGVFGFFIRKLFFNDKGGNGNKSLIQAGGDVSVGGDIIAGNKTVISHTKSEEEGRSLKRFEALIENDEWRKEIIDHKEIWICERDNTYQIEQGEANREFKEEWTKVYPNQNSYLYPVYLKISGVQIKELSFIFLDGGRIFVPLPQVESENGQRRFIWRRESLVFKVGRIIGDFYIYDSLEGIAKMSSIKII